MADADAADPQITFKVKTSGDGLHTLTMAESATVLDLKTKLATEEYENIPVERQRLIYSGRVMKNDDTLGSYKIKAGNTLHLVKSAASNHPPAGSSSAASTAGAAASVPPAVPTNMAAGTPASNLLAGLTGARFAGHAALPNQDIFGPDGGMNIPNEDHLSEMMTNPAVVQSMNEALNNPNFVDFLLQSNPALRDTPHARELIQSPMFRNMLTNPESLRMMARMRRAMAGGGAAAFPAPGATDNTPSDAPASPTAGGNAAAAANPFGAGFNPFLFGFPGAGAGAPGGDANANAAAGGAAANPFMAFFPPNFGAPAAAGAGTAAAGTGAAGATPGAAAASATPAGATPGGAAPASGGAGAAAGGTENPFSFLFGGAGGQAPQGLPQMTPEMMQQAMQMFGGGAGGAGAGAGFNPFMPQAAAARDTRPPEEMYAEQLRQLNDMGFYDFDQNVAALRRSGGSVQGAIQHLLGD